MEGSPFINAITNTNKKGGCRWSQQLAIHLKEPVIFDGFLNFLKLLK